MELRSLQIFFSNYHLQLQAFHCRLWNFHRTHSPFSYSHTFNTHIHAAVPGDEVVAAPSTAWVDELLAHLGGCVVVIPSYGGWTPPFVQRVLAEHRNSCKINHKKKNQTTNHSLWRERAMRKMKFSIAFLQGMMKLSFLSYEVLSQSITPEMLLCSFFFNNRIQNSTSNQIISGMSVCISTTAPP